MFQFYLKKYNLLILNLPQYLRFSISQVCLFPKKTLMRLTQYKKLKLVYKLQEQPREKWEVMY